MNSNWTDNLKLEEGEFITSYKSEFFDTEISITFMDTEDQIHPKQTELVNQLIENEKSWIEDSISSIIEYYKKVYKDYRSGWESGGVDEVTIEQYLPKEINREKLLELISPGEIYISPEEECEDGKFGFALDCEWDEEHGVGVAFENWKVKEVGVMDVAFL